MKKGVFKQCLNAVKIWGKKAKNLGFTIEQQVYIKRLFDRQDEAWVEENQKQANRIINDIAEVVIAQNALILREQEKQNERIKHIKKRLDKHEELLENYNIK